MPANEPFMEMPVCRALAVRVQVAMDCLDYGDIAGAMAVLRQCRTALPEPDSQHMRAARDVLTRIET